MSGARAGAEVLDAATAYRHRLRGAVGRRVASIGVVTAAEASLVLLGVAVAVVLRVWQINRLGFNSDEAVYAGQAASIANDADLKPFFPIFRAHPLLFQTILSLGYRLGTGDLFARLLADLFGAGAVVVTFLLGRLLYGRRAGVIAALLLALMPYHVVVSRQVLLDGPMTFFATLTLYLVALALLTGRPAWLYAAGATMGLTVLGKETSILVLGGAYVFFTLSPEVRVRNRHIGIALGLMTLVVLAYPLALRLAAHSRSGQQYLAYQLFRRPNHDWSFYAATVPAAIGPLVVAAAVGGLWLLRREISWRETLLLSWIAAPALFFQLYPVKGFQYLLPCAPPVAVLAGRTLARWQPSRTLRIRSFRVPTRFWMTAAAVGIAASIAVPTWHRIRPSTSQTFLAGSGGVPGGRELGRWIGANVPRGAELLTIGPSMANIVQFYGHRRAWALSVGPNPLRRNPAYDPLPNPDLAIRTNEVQYLVWDAFSASRTSFFAAKLLTYARRYHGRVLHTESVPVAPGDSSRVRKPLIVVYGVRR
jgi:dolichyl-phosphate-mannose-protein mannosyltransferase